MRAVVLLHRGINGDSMFANNLMLLDYSAVQPTCLGGAGACDLLLYRERDATYPIDVEFAANLWHVTGYTAEPWDKRPAFFDNPNYRTFGDYQAAHEPAALGSDPILSSMYTVNASSPVYEAGIDATPPWVDVDLANFGVFAIDSINELDFFGNDRTSGSATDIGMQEI
jgi:hypothetical protein